MSGIFLPESMVEITDEYILCLLEFLNPFLLPAKCRESLCNFCKEIFRKAGQGWIQN